MTKFSLNLIESDNEISKAIKIALRDHMSTVFNKLSYRISKPIKNIVKQALMSEPEYASLKGGKLRYELGISNTSNVDMVIDSLVNTLNIQSNPITYSSRSLSGGISLTMMKSDDLGGVINTQEAFVDDAQRGYSLPWLEWLLLKGNTILVYNYEVKLGSNPKSRTGNAIMVSSKQNWRIPTEFVGSEKNNWTTRAVAAAEYAIIAIIEKEIKDLI
jgi:hypothetical protein